ncbi:MAG: hypothetical protein GJ680_02190 [Alteromonadaceae bacterium]|nr:hypothetical protein [Alteromonadaceae bacterium]
MAKVLLLSGFVFFVGLFFWIAAQKKRLTAHRAHLIDTYQFPESVSKKVKQTYPHLSDEDVLHVLEGLRNYFHLINDAGKNTMVSMPSQAVDVAWHEFILDTKEYALFCDTVFKRFIHHTPAEAMQSQTVAQDAIKRVWRLACARENISISSPMSLPILFAMDAKLDIKDGFNYSLDCKPELDKQKSDGSVVVIPYCASHIGGDDGHASAGTSDSDGSGGADGGSGCGGGGCGGGS